METPGPFTAHLKRVAAFGPVLLGVLSVLGVLVPPVVGPTPVEGIEVTRPLRMFWWFFPLECSPPHPGSGCFQGTGPEDRGGAPAERRRPRGLPQLTCRVMAAVWSVPAVWNCRNSRQLPDVASSAWNDKPGPPWPPVTLFSGWRWAKA